MSKKAVPLQSDYSNLMNALDDTLYYALQGLETRLAMQYNCHLGWSCRHIVRTGIEVAQTMLGDEEVEAHKDSYYTLISRRMCSEPRETMMVIIVMQVLFRLIQNDSQARRCGNTFADDWCEEIEDMYHSYRRAVDEQIDIELTKQPNQTFTVTVMKTDQPQTVIKVAGNYIAEQNIDIHDNQNVYLGGECKTEQPQKQTAPQATEIKLFSCITKTAYDEGKAQKVEDELRSACVNAPNLFKAIRTNEALGYLDTKNFSSQALYNNLNEHFGLRFKYPNFTKYRRD